MHACAQWHTNLKKTKNLCNKNEPRDHHSVKKVSETHICRLALKFSHSSHVLFLCDPVDCSMQFPVHHQLPEVAQTHVHPHVHGVSDAIQLSTV